MSCVENLAAFVCRSAYEDLSEATREQLKIRILDSIGCAVGACEGLTSSDHSSISGGVRLV